jgi:hypothetical protein
VFSSIVDPPTLGTIACREALAIADDLGLRHIMVPFDCKQVVEDISMELVEFMRVYALVFQ